MKIRPAAYLLALLLAWAPAAGAQDTGGDSVRVAADSLAADSLSADSLARPQSGAPADSTDFYVRPWAFHPSLGAHSSATDSTLRWEFWPDWSYKRNTDPGAITYRLGTMGRTNAVQAGAQEPRYQDLFWENIPMNDPVSGSAHWFLVPNNKVLSLNEENLGGSYRSRYFLKPYYLVEPLSHISYQESSFDTRFLEFMVSHNLSRRTNAEISYWDRRDGGGFSNSSVYGRQVFARLFHQLSRREALKLQFSSDSYTAGQPFGYVVGDPFSYNFDRFTTLARENSAESELSSTLIALQYYRRPPAPDSVRIENTLQAGFWYRSSGRDLSYSADTVSYSVPSFGASMRRWWERGPLTLEAGAEVRQLLNGDPSDYTRSYLGRYGADAALQVRLHPLLNVGVESSYGYRSDGFDAYRLHGTAVFNEEGALGAEAGWFTGSRMPTPQQLYWSAGPYAGNTGLRGEKWSGYHGALTYRIFPGLTGRTGVEVKRVEDAVMVDFPSDSGFVNFPSYWSSSATTRLSYESSHLELSGSATLHSLSELGSGWREHYRGEKKRKLWLKWGAYWKGYLFSRATYVKAGISGVTSALRYRPDHYVPALDYWQPAGGQELLPRFHRLDAEVSARVRTIMITLRWENVLDDLTQQGYFETAGYPMPGRRLLFGIRALFRN